MKNGTLALTLISVLFFSMLVGTIFIDFATAQTDYTPKITVFSPIENGTYTTSNVNLKFNVKPVAVVPSYVPRRDQVTYQLDSERVVVLPEGVTTVDTVLENLPNGEHNVTIYAASNYPWLSASNWCSSSVVVSFFVEKAPPRVSFVSGQQQAFGSGVDVSFNFTVFEPEGVSWLGYSLEEGNVVTVTDNASCTVSHMVHNCQLTLSDLSDGVHSLTVYAEDLAGNVGESEAFQFTVGEEAHSEPDGSEPEPSGAFPTTPLIAIIASVTVVSIGLLVHFKKRKR